MNPITRTLLLAFCCSSSALAAQTTHFVTSGGSSLTPNTPPFYEPATLTIAVGDNVRWTNVSGTHNVNGTTFLFPGNPQDFYSGLPANGAWSYLFNFTIPGTYEYHCDSEGHSATQFGTIIVLGPNAVDEGPGLSDLHVYPSPAVDMLSVDVGPRVITRSEILSVDGRVVASPGITGTQVIQIPVSELPAGNYMIRLVESNGMSNAIRFTKK